MSGEVSRLWHWLPFVLGSFSLGLWVPYATPTPSTPFSWALGGMGGQTGPHCSVLA